MSENQTQTLLQNEKFKISSSSIFWNDIINLL
jgi:hypothetical protein